MNISLLKPILLIAILLITLSPNTAFTQIDTLEIASQQINADSTGPTQKETGLLRGLENKVPEQPAEAFRLISFSKIFWSIVLLIIGYYLMKFIIGILNIIAERSTRMRLSLKSIIPVVRIGMWILIGFVIIKGIFDPPVETIIAVTASISIAVGFAAQDILKNVFGGIILLLDRPFKVGDKIDTGKHYGEVLEIGLRITRLVTVDDSVVSVPNAELVGSAISNSNSGELNCQVVAEIFLPLSIDTAEVRRIATQAAMVSKYVYLKKPVYVHFSTQINPKTMYYKMRLKAYVMDVRYEADFQSDMTEIIIRELIQRGMLSGQQPI